MRCPRCLPAPAGKDEGDQLDKILSVVGAPTEATMPGCTAYANYETSCTGACGGGCGDAWCRGVEQNELGGRAGHSGWQDSCAPARPRSCTLCPPRPATLVCLVSTGNMSRNWPRASKLRSVRVAGRGGRLDGCQLREFTSKTAHRVGPLALGMPCCLLTLCSIPP